MRIAGNFDRLSPDDNLARFEAPEFAIPGSLGLGPTDTRANKLSEEAAGIRFPIRMKVTLPYLILALIIAVMGAYIVTRIVFDTIEERFTNQLLETGKIAAEWMVKEEDELLETLRLVAHTEGTETALRDGNAEALREIAYPILLNAAIDALEIVDLNGETVLSLRHREGGLLEEYDVSRGDRSLQDWHIVNQVRDQNLDDLGDKYADIALADWGDYLYVSGPVLDQDQELVGVVLVGDSLSKIAEEIRATTLSQVTIYDLEGQEITTTFIESGSQLNPETLSGIISRQDKESYMQELAVANIPYQGLYAPLEVRSGIDVGIIATSLAKTMLVRASNTTRFEIFGFVTTAFLFIIAVGLFTADRFTKPLLKVVDASSQVAAGNLDISVTPKGNDEVSALAKSFNQMVSSLQHSKSELIRAHEDTLQAYDRTIEGWCKALELRDNVTEGHTLRVTDLTLLIARQMEIGNEALVHIRRGALMHDIGKMAIPDSILKKPASLDDDEWIEMRKHPIYAYEMLNRISYLAPSLAIPYCHHEKWDGTGYPRGIAGEEIPLEARIFAIADVWDALCSDRPYRKALPAETALKYIEDNRGTHFDPKVVDAFLIVFTTLLADKPAS
ncbi:MAG: HD domain-containing protein [Anaerolineales bacterium]|nr:HD domain-containing protein [Anaerolineales bacterium]